MNTITFCGVTGHSEECLCDVVITTTTPVRYHFNEVWHANLIARATGYRGEGGAALADFLEALAHGYDATRNLTDLDVDWLDGILTSGLRERAIELLQEGESILDLPDMLGDSFTRIVASLTACQAHVIWTWDDQDWLEFEDALNASDVHTAWQIAQRFDIGNELAASLIVMYGKRLNAQVRADKKSVVNAILAEHHALPFKELYAKFVEADLDYAPETVKSFRKRWRKAQGHVNLIAAAAITLPLVACSHQH